MEHSKKTDEDMMEYDKRLGKVYNLEGKFDSLKEDTDLVELLTFLKDWSEVIISYWEIAEKIGAGDVIDYKRFYKKIFTKCRTLRESNIILRSHKLKSPSYDAPILGLNDLMLWIPEALDIIKGKDKKTERRKSKKKGPKRQVKITERQKEAYVAIHAKNLTLNQAAIQMNCSKQNVSNLLKIAEQKVKASNSRSAKATTSPNIDYLGKNTL